ncbi:Endoglycoceramidase [Hondaea fermentalgiana]|uniref:Endoglycoceramidase n=1 Tax=Hondaea fermentalgiana TaxID=2315210 RepID=A0A2R5GIH4_9STRA|nr:Endoglycoceramidase [Hondaea fermentalgiana]|eukprot:GBG27674.1 Endoglycoceramidase [Hondaea fermentalgiana]
MSDDLGISMGLYNTLSAEGSPLTERDRMLVPIMTMLSLMLGNLSPEEMIGAGLLTTAFLVGTISRQCFRSGGKLRLLGTGFAIAVACAGILSFEHLKVPSVDQRPEIYGKTPFEKRPKVPGVGGELVCDGSSFLDDYGRTLMLRGVNLGGDSKIPVQPKGDTWRPDSFGDPETVSFVGRPFPLEEADEHLGRLRSWGFSFLRFIVTWEAIEHAGPGKYDAAYLDYLLAVIRKCAEHEISVFIDPHQDVWSRWTGGDGAPRWTLDKIGFNVSNLHTSGASVTHQEFGDPFPRMVWPTNYNRLAAATMFTLFFAGDVYAPNTLVDGVPVQTFLQGHYIAAMRKVAQTLQNETNVLGYDTLNEPSNGYVGLKSLNKALFPAPMGWFMSAFDGMRLGSGESLKVARFSAPLILHSMETVNPDGILAWKSQAHDVWQNEGVWQAASGSEPAKVLRSDHFALNAKGGPVNFMRDFMAPFFDRYREAIHAEHPSAVIFAEGFIDPNKPEHDPAPVNMQGGPKVAWAPHFYDGLTLILKRFRPWVALDLHSESPVLGERAASAAISSNLAKVRKSGASLANQPRGAPILVGEVGIPMDLDRDADGVAEAYKTGDFSAQIRALDRTMRALEDNLFSFTLWNYAAANSHKRGELWNDEDLSLFSRDDQGSSATEDLNSGGRALQAAVRPYPMKTCGTPLRLHFDALSASRRFEFEFIPTKCKDGAPTVLFVPSYQYPNGVTFESTSNNDAQEDNHDLANNVIYFSHPPQDAPVTIIIEANKT